MKRLFLFLIAALGVACAPSIRPSTPAPDPTFTLRVCLVDETGAPIAGTIRTDGIQPRGETAVPAECLPIRGLLAAGFNVIAGATNHASAVRGIDQPVNQTVTLVLRSTAKSNAGERGPLHIGQINGRPFFAREDGSIFPWIGASDFALFARYLKGEDITPILDQRIAFGFTILRVFTMFDRFGIGAAAGTGELNPVAIPDFYPQLRAFTDILAARGLRVELVVLADADQRNDEQRTGGLLPTIAQQQEHLTRVLAAVAGAWNVTIEWSNEPFKNAIHVAELTGDCRAAGVLCAYGWGTLDRGQRTMVHLDYVTTHDHERKDEWPRTARALDEVREGFSWNLDDPSCWPACSQHPDNAAEFAGVHVPVVGDEPMGFAEVPRPGRWTIAIDGAYYAAASQLMGAGSTFHSDDGVASRLWPPVQLAAAKAWAAAAKWVPAEAQLAPYQRGGDCGTSGIGAMPVEHCDLGSPNAPSQALRTFAKFAFEAEWVVRIRPIGPTIPRDGWKIAEEPRLGFVKLVR